MRFALTNMWAKLLFLGLAQCVDFGKKFRYLVTSLNVYGMSRNHGARITVASGTHEREHHGTVEKWADKPAPVL